MYGGRMIIYTCPKCGEPLTSFIVAVYPPIDVSECRKCGWRHESKPDSVKYIPFPKDLEE